MKDEFQSDQCARKLRALADADRLRIIACLRAGPKNVSEIAAELEAQLVNVSHHLGVLRNAELVEVERQGRFVVYRLHPDVYQHCPEPERADHLNLGCCRLELPES